MVDIRPVVFVLGLLLVILASAMGVTGIVDYFLDDVDWQAFVASAAATLFAAMAMILGTRPSGPMKLNTQQSFLITALAWAVIAAFGALPFCFSILDLSYTDAYFETMSGLTTTGSTVIVGLDQAPSGVLLWRSILHWLGGIGIIVVAVAILPLLKIGGMQLFRMESSDKTEKVRPRVRQIAGAIFMIYTAFTVLCTLLLWAAGMTFFEAINHAMATLSTGGFSTSDASVGHWESPLIHWIIIVFMAVGGMTFVLFIPPVKGGDWQLFRDSQTAWFFYIMGVASMAIAIWQYMVGGMGLHDAVRHSAFTVVSIVTTTGFATADWNLWGGFPLAAAFVLTFIGGCTGSTAGGIKIFRFEVLFTMAGIHVKKLVHPNGIFLIDFNKQKISDAVVRSVLGFAVLYAFCYAGLAMGLALLDLDPVTSLTGAATALANVGPGLGEIIGPAGNFKPLPDAAKWLLSFGMMLGRLELLTVIVLFTRSFWRG